MKWFWILSAVVLGLLFLSNPDMEDFKTYIAEEARELVREQTGAPGLGDILSDGAAQMAESYADEVTEHKDYYLFSTYKINIAPRNVSKRTWHFLGIGNNFINLTRFYDKE